MDISGAIFSAIFGVVCRDAKRVVPDEGRGNVTVKGNKKGYKELGLSLYEEGENRESIEEIAY